MCSGGAEESQAGGDIECISGVQTDQLPTCDTEGPRAMDFALLTVISCFVN